MAYSMLLTLIGCAAPSSEFEPVRRTTEALITQTTTTSSTSTVVENTVTTTVELDWWEGDDPEDLLMPDVVCMSLQAAQVEIQDHGVFSSEFYDATGQGRPQILHSEWIVVEQGPAPGQSMAHLVPMLSVVKIGEPTGGVC
jgi:hypothetical protein